MSAIDGETVCAWIEEHVNDVQLTSWQREFVSRWFDLRRNTTGGGSR